MTLDHHMWLKLGMAFRMERSLHSTHSLTEPGDETEREMPARIGILSYLCLSSNMIYINPKLLSIPSLIVMSQYFLLLILCRFCIFFCSDAHHPKCFLCVFPLRGSIQLFGYPFIPSFLFSVHSGIRGWNLTVSTLT